ncbi:MAG: M48 family metallopeptidase [Candidatus Pacebacteria bacterium]|nr:M48 family metallopeptidase [Candidatus Paceibacterota bacterium]
MPWRLPKYLVEKFVESKKEWIQDRLSEQKLRPQKLLAHYSAKDFKEYKEKARIFVLERITHFNTFYNYKIGKVFIRNQKTRWGSCSSKGNLNFNYKIVLLPIELADYIVVHELCHLSEMNHGKHFWELVAQQSPNYKNLRKQISLY